MQKFIGAEWKNFSNEEKATWRISEADCIQAIKKSTEMSNHSSFD